jgi:hypothetical protein
VTPTARTPEDAVAFLDGVGTGIRASVVLNGEGRVAASSSTDGSVGRRMGELARDLFERADRAFGGEVPQLEVSTPAGTVFAVRQRGWAVAVVAGRLALSSLVLFDLHRLVLDLAAASQ